MVQSLHYSLVKEYALTCNSIDKSDFLASVSTETSWFTYLQLQICLILIIKSLYQHI